MKFLKVWLSPRILDLAKVLKIFKNNFCIESFSGHFKKEFFFPQQKIFNTCKIILKFLKIWLSPRILDLAKFLKTSKYFYKCWKFSVEEKKSFFLKWPEKDSMQRKKLKIFKNLAKSKIMGLRQSLKNKCWKFSVEEKKSSS